MVGHKEKCFRTHETLSLEQLVPKDNFYRQVEAKLDLGFVYDLVKASYARAVGRPSIDPIVFFKLQLIMFFEGIRSERQLMETVNLNLAHRWYIGYDFDETVPDHSSLSKIRSRYGLSVFQQFFEKIVELCLQAGLIWGQELYFDGTKVRANAAMESLVPRWFLKAKQHVQALFGSAATATESSTPPVAPAQAEPPVNPPVLRLLPPCTQRPVSAPTGPNAEPCPSVMIEKSPEPPARMTVAKPVVPATQTPTATPLQPLTAVPSERRPTLRVLARNEAPLEPTDPAITPPGPSRRDWRIEKYDGQRLNEHRTATYQRTTDSQVSRTDPDATPMSRFTGDRSKLGYHTHYVVDGGKSRIILAALVTPASVMDNTPMLDLARWTRFRWHLNPKIAVGDTKYGTIENIVGLERDGLRAYVPMTDFSQRTKFYPAERFQYEAASDRYRCPQGVKLRLYSRREREELLVYRAPESICNQCPVKAECTGSRSGRHIFRSFFQEYVDRVHAYHETAAYQKALRKRMVWVEPLFGEAKQWHQRAQFRLRGLRKVNMEELVTAAGQNIKRLVKHRQPQNREVPAAAVVALPADPPSLLSRDLSLAA